MTKKEQKDFDKTQCMECENDTIQDYADLMIEYDRQKAYITILEDILGKKSELIKYYREQIEKLETKVELWKGKAEK